MSIRDEQPPAPARVPPVALARAVEWVRYQLSRIRQRLTPAPAAMLEMIVAAWSAQAIAAAAQLGVADALQAGPLPIEELATRVGADADALSRLLRALISHGIFRRRPDGRYELNALADTLRRDAPVSMAAAARFYGSTEQRERWSLLADAIRTGKSVVPVMHGTDGFGYFAADPEHADLFDQTMTSVSRLADATVVAGYDFGAFSTVIDVGGGRGPLLSAILASAPHTRGILYDLPSVVAAAGPVLGSHGVSHRVKTLAGSFFDEIPAGGDAYVLKNVIHDWPDEDALRILRTLRAATGVEATVLLVEFVIPAHDREFPGKWVDLEMLLNLGARERSAEEYRSLLSRAGFALTRVVPTASPLSLVEARPV
jgi:O-methyltransferase/methyltransferase family protein